MSRDNAVTTQPAIGPDHPDSNHEEFDQQQRSGVALRAEKDIEPLPSLDYPWPQPQGRAVELDDLLMLERTELLLTHCVFTLLPVTNNP